MLRHLSILLLVGLMIMGTADAGNVTATDSTSVKITSTPGETKLIQTFPKVPKWLNQMAADPMTRGAAFLPNGSILVGLIEPIARRTTGAGLEVPQDSQGKWMEGYYIEYYLYSNDGLRLPSRDRKSSYWMDAIWDTVGLEKSDPHYKTLPFDAQGAPKGAITSNVRMVPGGYTEILDPATQVIQSIYDWDGTKLYDIDHPYEGVLMPNKAGVVELPERNENYCIMFKCDTILRAYNFQTQ